jgi:hypothetical protein
MNNIEDVEIQPAVKNCSVTLQRVAVLTNPIIQYHRWNWMFVHST